MGVIEFIVSCGVGGMVYAVLCGQPLTFLGPTGLTLAFTGALYRFVEGAGLPFLPMYSWIGLWTSFFLAIGAVFNVSYFIRFCTRFTDDCFNSLISLNFLYEAVRSVARSFTQAGTDLGSAFFSMNLALATWASTTGVANFKQSKLVSSSFREGGLYRTSNHSALVRPQWVSHLLCHLCVVGVAKFGPSLVIVAMSALAAHPAVAAQLTVETLAVPARLSLAGGRALVPDLLSVSPVLRLAAALPAVLLTLLFYLDQVRALICPYPGLYLSLSSPYLCSSTWTRCALPASPSVPCYHSNNTVNICPHHSLCAVRRTSLCAP